MRRQARLLLADRSYEGALLTRLLYYGGVGAMLETARSGDRMAECGGGSVIEHHPSGFSDRDKLT